MRHGLTDARWVDYGLNQHKRQGAYSNGVFPVGPYIFMSWNDTLPSMSTLAHEIGHSMHTHLSWKHQPYAHARLHAVRRRGRQQLQSGDGEKAPVFSHDDTDFQVALIEEAMGNFHRYFFIMPTLARFEQEIHARVEAGRSLSAPDLNALMADLLQDGYGDGVEMDRERSGILWGQFSTHLYSNFYAYQYATGISAAHQASGGLRQRRRRRPGALPDLPGEGGRLDPLDALRNAGVDMEKPDAVERTFEVLAGYVDRLEALLAERLASQPVSS